MSIKLRSYQKEACRETYRLLFREGKDSGVICLPTGAGKTFTAAILTTLIQQKHGYKILWFAHREELIRQAVETFRKVAPGLSLSTWMANRIKVDGEFVGDGAKDAMGDVVFCMIKSSRRLPQRLKAINKKLGTKWLLVVDEAHHYALPRDALDAKSYRSEYIQILRDSIEKDQLTPKKIGLTATPERLDERPLAFDELFYEVKFVDLVRMGHLARPVYYEMRTTENFGKLDIRGGDYTAAALRRLNTPKRNAAIAQEYVRNREKYGKTLIFACDVRHAHDLQLAFAAEMPDLPVEVITGSYSKDDRKRVKHWLDKGAHKEPKVLINCFDQETEVLTTDGWRKGDELTGTEFILQVNPETGCSSWIKPRHYFSRPVQPSEHMVHCKTQQVDVRVTEDHRFLWTTQYRHQQGRKPKVYPALKVARKKHPIYVLGTSQLKQKGLGLDKAELQLLGWYLTDGNLSGTSLRIAQNTSSPNTSRIRQILNLLALDFKERKIQRQTNLGYNDLTEFTIPKGTGSGSLKRAGWHKYTAYLDKKGPWIRQLNREELMILLEEMELGDGVGGRASYENVRGRWTRAFCTVVPELADNVQFAAALNNLTSSVSWHDNSSEKFPNALPLATVRTVNRTWIATNGTGAFTVKRPKSSEKVWCLTTDEGFILTRRHGRVCVQGQCMVYTEGFDCPTLNSVFLARPTVSRSLWMQMVGRGARVVHKRVDIPRERISSAPDAGEYGVVELTDGRKKKFHVIASENGHVTVLHPLKNSFHLVNITDNITNYSTLVHEWTMDIRVDEEAGSYKKEKQEKNKRKKRRRRAQETLDAHSKVQAGGLDEAKLVDVQSVLIFSTLFQDRIGVPLDQDRLDCIRKLKEYCDSCWVKVSSPFKPDEEELLFDQGMFQQSYSFCVPANEFPLPLWTKLSWAYYWRYIAGKKTVPMRKKNPDDLNEPVKIAKTWQWIPFMDLRDPAVVKAARERVKKDLEVAREINTEFNVRFASKQKVHELFTACYNRAMSNKGIKPAAKTAISWVLKKVRGIAAKDRRLTVTTSIQIQGDSDPRMGKMYKFRMAMSEAMQALLNDSSCQVVCVTQSSRLTPEALHDFALSEKQMKQMKNTSLGDEGFGEGKPEPAPAKAP